MFKLTLQFHNLSQVKEPRLFLKMLQMPRIKIYKHNSYGKHKTKRTNLQAQSTKDLMLENPNSKLLDIFQLNSNQSQYNHREFLFLLYH